MNKIHVDSSMGIHISNGIVHIILGSDDISQKFYNGDDLKKQSLKVSNIISMPLVGFIETLNILQNFANEPHIKMILDNYVDVGILKGEEDEK